MKRLTIITLLLLVAAFSFSQSNATFNNLDVRGTSKLRGIPYSFGAVAANLNPTLHEVAVINNSTFALCRIDFQEFADSIANHINAIIGTHWYSVSPDTIKTIYNVVVDKSFLMKYNGNYLGLFPDTTLYMFQIDMATFKYSGMTVANVPYQTINISSDDLMETEEARVLLSNDARPEVLINSTRTDSNSYMFIVPTQISLTNNTDGNLTQFIIEEDRFIMDELSNTSGTSLMMWDSVSKEVTRVQNVTVPGDLTITGQITYDYIHLVAYTTGGSYTPNTVSNVEFKLVPGFSTNENDGLTFAGDSITVITPGDYFIQFGVSLQGANGSDWIFKCRKNGTAITTGNLAVSTTGAGNYIAGEWFWYLLSLVAGDDISFSVTNEGGSDDPTFRSIKVFMEMKPE